MSIGTLRTDKHAAPQPLGREDHPFIVHSDAFVGLYHEKDHPRVYLTMHIPHIAFVSHLDFISLENQALSAYEQAISELKTKGIDVIEVPTQDETQKEKRQKNQRPFTFTERSSLQRVVDHAHFNLEQGRYCHAIPLEQAEDAIRILNGLTVNFEQGIETKAVSDTLLAHEAVREILTESVTR